MQDFFNKTKHHHCLHGKIENCRLCEYRFTCFDCQALGKSASGRLDGMAVYSYRPEKGEWAN